MRVQTRYDGNASPTEIVVLRFDDRRKSRLRTRSTSGVEFVLALPRGGVLRHGDLLVGEDGTVIRIEAALEEVSRVASEDPWLLARAAYHLGNRHIPLQIEPRALSYLHDHVLDRLVEELELTVVVAHARFEPEAGAYGGHGPGHSHEHSLEGGAHSHD